MSQQQQTKLVATGVDIANLSAAPTGSDACASMVQREIDDYGPILEELTADRIEYMPLVWTCWGRPHVDAEAALRAP